MSVLYSGDATSMFTDTTLRNALIACYLHLGSVFAFAALALFYIIN